MKKTYIFLFFLFIWTGNQLKAKDFVTICGTKGEERIKIVQLYAVRDGEVRKIAETDCSVNDFFGFCFEPEYEGFYLIGSNEFFLHRIYVTRKGQRIEVELKNEALEFCGVCSPENIALGDWEKRLADFKEKTYYSLLSFRSYKAEELTGSMEKVLQEAREYQKNLKADNKRFEELMRETTVLDLCYFASFYLLNTEQKDDEVANAFRKIICASAFTSGAVLQNGFGNLAISDYFMVKEKYDHQQADINFCMEEMQDSTIRGRILVEELATVPTYEEFYRLMNRYGKYLVIKSQLAEAHRIGAALYVPEVGKQAADFTYPDRSGKLISLSDFKGKIVVVETWATWCAPCIKALPGFCRLAGEYDPDDVVFLGVSFNKQKEKAQWIKIMDKFRLEPATIQVLADGFSEIAAYYRMQVAGQYLIVDREGRIAKLNAPQEPEKLKVEIEKLRK